MIFYVTFNDYPSGIFSSQVIDVVKFMNENGDSEVKLISFISIRDFFKTRRKIKLELNRALVVPMFPKLEKWKLNQFTLKFICWIYKPRLIIGRSVFATQLALLQHTYKVVYDGRGAISAEFSEYNVANSAKLNKHILPLEQACVLKSDYRISVSHALLDYWRQTFHYTSSAHQIIPCTLNTLFCNLIFNETIIQNARKKLGYTLEDVVLIYSGSTSGWQTLNALNELAAHYLTNQNFKLIILAKSNAALQHLQNQFPKQVIIKLVKPNEVPEYLLAADYGLLIREPSVTNQVASPVKFAEYLACGLHVLISKQLGDYSDFVINNKVGFIFGNDLPLRSISFAQKVLTRNLALQHFQKRSYLESYKAVESVAATFDKGLL